MPTSVIAYCDWQASRRAHRQCDKGVPAKVQSNQGFKDREHM